jgi:hypothetical protein
MGPNALPSARKTFSICTGTRFLINFGCWNNSTASLVVSRSLDELSGNVGKGDIGYRNSNYG